MELHRAADMFIVSNAKLPSPGPIIYSFIMLSFLPSYLDRQGKGQGHYAPQIPEMLPECDCHARLPGDRTGDILFSDLKVTNILQLQDQDDSERADGCFSQWVGIHLTSVYCLHL